MPRLFLLALLALAAGAPSAQVGFSLFNGRNHPELDWQVATTEHFEIMYPARLAGIEAEAAAIAEATLDALAVNLAPDSTALAFDDPIRIYLSDEDEIANGIALNVGSSGFTTIWVHVNDDADDLDRRRQVAPQGDRPRARPPRPLPRDPLEPGPARRLLRRPAPELLDRGPGAVRRPSGGTRSAATAGSARRRSRTG